MASNVLLRGIRIDLTENNLYTLRRARASCSKASRSRSISTCSSRRRTRQNLPALRTLRGARSRDARGIRRAARRTARSCCMSSIRYRSPRTRTVRRSTASRPRTSGPRARRCISAWRAPTASDDRRIPFFQPDPAKEAFLEYDLARLVYNLAHPNKVVVGLLSGAPMHGGFDPETQQPSSRGSSPSRRGNCSTSARCSRDADDRGRRGRILDRPSGDVATDALRDRPVRAARRPPADLRGSGRGDPVRGCGPQRFVGARRGPRSSRCSTAWGVKFAPSEVVADKLRVSIRSGQRPIRHMA